MDVDMIEDKINKIILMLENEVLEAVEDQSLDKKQTNLKIKPLVSTKKILLNAIDSIKLVHRVSKENR